MKCANTECFDRAQVKGRCDTCYRYHRKHGVDRSEVMVITAGERYLQHLIENACIRLQGVGR